MRWFKHMTNSRRDTFLLELRYKFGSDGYAAWFITIEMLAEAVKPDSPRAKINAHPRAFAEECMIPPDRLEHIYRFAAQRGKISFRRRRGTWTVEIPKVLEFRDEYTDKALKKEGVDIPTPSGESPEESRAEAEADTEAEQSRAAAAAKRPAKMAGRKPLEVLCDEFTSMTGRVPMAQEKDLEELVRLMDGFIETRGLEACVAVMREKTQALQARTGKPPSTLRYFVSVFEDDANFGGNGTSGGVEAWMREQREKLEK